METEYKGFKIFYTPVKGCPETRDEPGEPDSITIDNIFRNDVELSPEEVESCIIEHGLNNIDDTCWDQERADYEDWVCRDEF